MEIPQAGENFQRGGAQQIELDLDVLAHAQPGFGDLRVLRGSNQVPYIIQRTSISRALTLTVTATNDAKDPKFSRWIIKLPPSQFADRPPELRRANAAVPALDVSLRRTDG